MILKRILIAAVAMGHLGFAAHAGAADTDPVAATVDGYVIHLSDVESARSLLPQQLQGQPLEVVYPMLLNSLINSRLAAQKARAEGLDEDPAYKSRMARIGEQILERVLLSQHIERQVTDALVNERYAALVEQAKTQVEAHARHILVKTEDEAAAIVKELQGGADFEALAKERSTGPSGPTGGDLGWFGPGRMVPAFEKAAMTLKPGSFTEEPVQTQFGWHVIKVDEHRPLTPPTFEAARPGLVNALSAELGQALMDQLRSDAKVEQVDLQALK